MGVYNPSSHIRQIITGGIPAKHTRGDSKLNFTLSEFKWNQTIKHKPILCDDVMVNTFKLFFFWEKENTLT